MNIYSFIIINLYIIHLCCGRLIYKTTPNNYVKDHDKIKGQPISYESKVRLSRGLEEDNKTNTLTRYKTNKNNVVLVKKPIPKFKESDEESGLQFINPIAKLSNLIDHDHEDDDFNIDDYEFDVNHDEFAVQGKPLEPRVKANLKKLTSIASEMNTPLINKLQQFVPPPRRIYQESKKVSRQVHDKMKEDEYDNEFPDITMTEKAKIKTTQDSESTEEEVTSREYEINASVRRARSAWSFHTYMDKLGAKTSNVITKFLTSLPIFPRSSAFKKI